MIEDIIMTTGAILESSETDVSLGGVIQVPDKPLYRFEDRRVAFNQAPLDPYGCCYVSDDTLVANCRGIDWSQEDWQWFRDNAYKYGRKNEVGMKLGAAGDMVADRLNILHPDQGWVKYAVSVNTKECDELRAKGWMVQIGSFVNKSYRSQIHTGKITSPRGKDGGGHARCLFTSKDNGLTYEEENYLGMLPFNTIEIEDWEAMKAAGQYYNQGFILFPTHMQPTGIPQGLPYMTLDEALELEQKDGLIYADIAETVRERLRLAALGMRLQAGNYNGVVGVGKMYQDCKDYRNGVNQTK